MKIITFLILLVSTNCFSQILEPVKWTASYEKISEKEYDMVFTADIDDTWHLYSQNIPKNGPLPTVFIFENHSNYSLTGNMSEPKGNTNYDSTFEMDIKYFENKAVFKQRIKLKANTVFKIIGNIEYMTCNSEKCIQGYHSFEIKL